MADAFGPVDEGRKVCVIEIIQHADDFQFGVHPGSRIGRFVRDPLSSVVLDGRFTDFLQAAINLILKKYEAHAFESGVDFVGYHGRLFPREFFDQVDAIFYMFQAGRCVRLLLTQFP